ncbi:beta-glucosidase family protein [Labrys miyagiensis]|nr:glycoside hydrolase family 3 C-terminal domain-containing protein [Labrys miyagiensis]
MGVPIAMGGFSFKCTLVTVARLIGVPGLLFSVGVTAALSQQPAASPSAVSAEWRDTSLPAERRADLALAAMSRAEKLQLVFGYFSTQAPWMISATKNFVAPDAGRVNSAGYVPGIERLGIPALWETDAGEGVATQRSPNPRERTALPSGLALAASWDRQNAFAGGAMIGNEARLSGFNVQLAGGVNLLREPRNGRNFEYAGEDPLLAGTIVGFEIQGIQSNHIISTLKHFAFNDQETNRGTIDVAIDETAARESDLLAFQIANEIGKPGSVMCSYNRVNGAAACENDWLLNQVLKADWRFKGYVMSDWGAVRSTVEAAKAGLDQESGWAFDASAYFGGALREALNYGHVDQSRLDDMACRILFAMFANGLFDNPILGDQSAQINFSAHASVTRSAAEDSIVLLKNDDLLPLKSSLKTIAVIGGHADKGVLSGGGSSQVYPIGGLAVPNEGPKDFPGPMVFYPSAPMKALQSRSSATITYADGNDLDAAAGLASRSDIAIVFATQWAAESLDLPNLDLPNGQDALIAAVAKANPRTIVVLETGGPVFMPWLSQVGAVLEAWYPGTSGGEAIARILSGEVDPSGHLPATFPASLSQLPRPQLDGDAKLDEDAHPSTNYNVEGAAVGYKWFDKRALTPLFPFGYGLSFTRFDLGGLSAEPAGEGIRVSLSVRNVGKVEGKAVVQAYVGRESGSWEAPKRLGSFDKVELAAGESKSITLDIDPLLLATFDPSSKKWLIEPGDYKVIVGQSATDVAASTTVHLDFRELEIGRH